MSRVSPENRLIGFSTPILRSLNEARKRARKEYADYVEPSHILDAIAKNPTHEEKLTRNYFQLQDIPPLSPRVKDAIVRAADFTRKGDSNNISLKDFQAALIQTFEEPIRYF